MPLTRSVCAGLLFTCLITAGAQIETPQDLLQRLTPEQKQQFDTAVQAFQAQRFGAALTGFKQILQQLPADPVVSKFAAEAALNTGDAKFALDGLKPIAQANPDDWQAASLLARAYAETGDTRGRDGAMAHMVELRREGATPPNMQAYLLERIKVGDNTLLIRPSLVPWGPYKVYYLGQMLNPQGQVFFRMTLESSDADQAFFARQHPQEAAAGTRFFSMDGYAETGLDSNGQRSQQHMTFGFYTGEPSYEVVREKFLDIANRRAAPLSGRTGLIPLPQSKQ